MTQSEKLLLKFGIPGFDGLFNNPEPEFSHGGRRILNPDFNRCGISVPKQVSSSICIIGPDGVGKSVFAMHLASRYTAQSQNNDTKPFVFYISTDLNHEIAEEMWTNFALDTPSVDRDPFSENSGVSGAEHIELKPCTPDELNGILTQPPKNKVVFVDLAANTAGDDWGFLHHFISVLERPSSDEAKHLIIIDAVEGFETYVGEMDAFGERTSRRARIAQIMRLVKDKSHVLLVVEESKTNERLPEEFVTDVVIRLHKMNAKGYVRRTVEIEKARGQHYARGSHHYTIRNGKGSTTGEQENADDPRFVVGTYESQNKKEPRFQSYVFLPHSLHYFHRLIMERQGKGKSVTPSGKFSSFGIEYLDNMLGGEDKEVKRIGGYDSRGLPSGTITALVGDTLTQKSRLGRAFLSQSFSSVIDIYREMGNQQSIQENAESIFNRVNSLFDLKQDYSTQFYNECFRFISNLDWSSLIAEFTSRVENLLKNPKTAKNDMFLPSKKILLNKLSDMLNSADEKEKSELFCEWLVKNDNGIAVMITTNDIDHKYLVRRFADWLKPRYNEGEKKLIKKLIGYMERNTICRRIEIHDVSSSTMLNIFSKVMWEAQKKLLGDQFENYQMIFDRLGRIRVVIDDFSNFRNIYSDITEDTLLMPSIKFLLGRASVTTLIVDTQIGKPDIAVAERFASELRQMVDSNLYTWRVPFYGENRVAITAIPPLSSENAGIVRELRWETKIEGGPLNVDPHFEMYLGLEEGLPRPIPLEVRLFADVSYFDSYIDEENLLFSELFTPAKLIQGEENNKIIIKFSNTQYDVMRNMSYLQRDTRLDHTVVIGVDEFWGIKLPERRRSGSFRPQWNYLDSITKKANAENKDTDPYSLFQKGHIEIDGRDDVRRRHFFDEKLGYNLIGIEDQDDKNSIERVPFSWDFGFLLCKKDAWMRAAKKRVAFASEIKKEDIEIGEIWQKLTKVPNDPNEFDKSDHRSKPEEFKLTWRIFLDACQNVAEAESNRLGKRISAFDSSMVTPETFSCLFLEIWASEIFESKNSLKQSVKFAKNLSTRNWTEKKPQSLTGWLDKDSGYRLQLYKTWLLLVDVLDFSEMTQGNFGNFEFKTRLASDSAIAVRLWYKTACHWVESNSRSDAITAVRLPGHFSVRGDWFLAVAGGSRSTRLGERALDILCSRRANIVRLQQGLGLPTRRLDNNEKLRTRLVLNGEHGEPQNVEYENLKSIGENENENFFWLWRSNLNEYHRHSRTWHKWLNRVLHWWFEKKLRYESSWDPGFRTYDLISNGLTTRRGESELQKEFFELCEILKDELTNASSKSYPHG